MNFDKTKAVLDEDGNIKSFVLTIGGEDFHCQCGCNCFHKPDKDCLTTYRCNGCGTTYGKSNK